MQNLQENDILVNLIANNNTGNHIECMVAQVKYVRMCICEQHSTLFYIAWLCILAKCCLII